jgi:isoprenylcysteine carboxyl methyltransferase (ICMT) family protein YpbQ
MKSVGSNGNNYDEGDGLYFMSVNLELMTILIHDLFYFFVVVWPEAMQQLCWWSLVEFLSAILYICKLLGKVKLPKLNDSVFLVGS